MSAHDHGPSTHLGRRVVPGPTRDELRRVSRVLSGIAPSGNFTLGNYLGALRHWVTFQDGYDAFYCVVDLHALTSEIDPEALRANTLDAVLNLLAVGLDPDRSTLFVQSHVPEHPRLTWLLECTTTMGELRRMTQFKDKGRGQEAVRASLFTYPVLMAADILLYDASAVPVGDDQRQHLELAREVAVRFNNRYGETFVVPDAAIAGTGARVMDLQHPERKMSKSVDSPLGTIGLLDSDAEITRKIRRAVTDTDGEVRYDRAAKPGLANLLDLLAAATGRTPPDVALGYTRYGDLKNDVAAALCELLRPVRERRLALQDDRAYVDAVLERGATRAHEVAEVTYARAAWAIGLLPPPS
jgi:tryptophanyl-tRNA synthetase